MTAAEQLLREGKTIAVVGLSGKPDRTSYAVSRVMQMEGYRIIPVNPAEKEILGERAYPRLEDVPEKVDIVNIFRRPEHVPAVVESAIRIGAKGVWMQLGIEHEEAAAQAREAGLLVVENTCIMVARRLLPR